MKTLFTTALHIASLACVCAQQNIAPIDYVGKVNPLIGSNNDFSISHGNTLPLVARPFGMTTWVAQTAEGGNWMYNFNDTLIHALRATHQPSPWMGDFATFNLMPSLGLPTSIVKKRGAKFSHKKEKASPSYYEVDLLNTGIKAGITATERCGYLEFTFPQSANSLVYIDIVKGGAELKIFPDENKITGIAQNNSGGAPNNFSGFFVIYFDKPIAGFGTFENDSIFAYSTHTSGDEAKAYVNFNTKIGEKVHARIGTSFISLAQAELSLNTEIGAKTFAQIKKESYDIWNNEFSKIAVEGGTKDQQTIFYSAYYRTLLFPSKFYEYDASGNQHYYSPYNGAIKKGVMYTNNGIWDTYRAVFPFFTLMQPKIHAEFCQSLVNAYKEGGWLPRWLSPGYREIMIGVHAASLFADAYTKGIADFDTQTAFEGMLKDASQANPITIRNKEGLEHYNNKGYVLSTVRESVAKNVEYAYDDYCVYLMAKGLNKQNEASVFEKRAFNFKNTFDPSTNFMRAKDASGRWKSPFNPFSWGGDYTEGNAWHYLWSVFHDPAGLIDLMGGEVNFISKLDSVFTSPNTSEYSYYGFKIHEITEMENAKLGQYAHGNQPTQHMIYLYNYARQPWKAQLWARKIMTTLYGANQNGLCGDEDNGQTSAWYVMSALGFYPVCPGSAEYVIGSPLFAKATITLPYGNRMVINAEHNSQHNYYIQHATLNGLEHNKTFITHDAIVKGGKLDLKMGHKPNHNWGTATSSLPFSFSKTPFCSPPYNNLPGGKYDKPIAVKLSSRTDSSYITYTLDGIEPTAESTKYSSPVTISKTTLLKARTFHDNKEASDVITTNFNYEVKESVAVTDTKDGIKYEYYEGEWEVLPDFASLKATNSGVLNTFEITPRQRNDMFAMKFEGYLKVPQNAIYTIYSRTDDGCRITLDDEIIHEANGRHGMESYNEKVNLKAGFHKIKLEYNEISGGEGIEIQIEGGGIEKSIIGTGLLFYK